MSEIWLIIFRIAFILIFIGIIGIGIIELKEKDKEIANYKKKNTFKKVLTLTILFPLAYCVLDGLGNAITGLYIDNEYNNQGLFGTLNGTVKNIIIEESYIIADQNVGAIAGLNNGIIENCYNKMYV